MVVRPWLTEQGHRTLRKGPTGIRARRPGLAGLRRRQNEPHLRLFAAARIPVLRGEITMVIASRAKEVAALEAPTMRAAVFHAPGDIRVEEVPRPRPGPGEAVIRVTLTTICGTDVHILKGEYPVRAGPDRRPRAGRSHRGARPRCGRVRRRRTRPGRSHHAMWPVPCLPERQPQPVRSRHRL